MEKLDKETVNIIITVLTILILMLSWGIWIGAKSIFDGSYTTSIKILTAGILVIWGGVCVTAEYLVWRWKK